MKKIAFLDTVHPVLEDGLVQLGWICDNLTHLSESQVKEVLVNYHGIVIRSRFPMNEEFLKSAEKLEFIARSGAGMENIDVSYCESRGIKLFNAPEGNRNAVAEHALGMLLSLFNQLKKGDLEIRDGIWDREGNRGVELEGMTVGIIGYGNNGSAFAKKLRGFDVKILAHDKYKSGYGDAFVTEATLSEIQEKADVLSLNVPLTPLTKGLINNRFIHQMNKPFYLINLSRGAIVNTADLMDALETEKVKGACLDVLEYEKTSFEDMFNEGNEMPLPFKYLINAENVILSPHVGGWTTNSYFKLSAVLLEKIKTYTENN